MQFRRFFRRLIFSCLTLICGLFIYSQTVLAQIVIGEVNWSGSALSTADEWIELWNLTDSDITLDRWRITGAANLPIHFTANQIIPAYQTYLISNYAVSNTKTLLTTTPQLVANLTLSNNKLGLVLENSAGEIVDRAGNGGLPPAGSAKEPWVSMIRQDQFGTIWASSTQLLNLRVTSTQLGTPGFCDLCIVASSVFIASSTTAITDMATSTPSTEFSSSTAATMDSYVETISTSDTTTTLDLIPIANTSTAFIDIATTSSLPLTYPTLSETAANFVSSTTSSSISQSSATSAAPATLSLYAVSSASRPEWVTIEGSATFNESLFNWRLEDAIGLITTFSSSSERSFIEPDRWRIVLPGTHLNNDGDTLYLKNGSTEIVDSITIPAMSDGEAYVRFATNSWSIVGRNVVTSTTVSNMTTSIPPNIVNIASPSMNASVVSMASTVTATSTFRRSSRQSSTSTHMVTTTVKSMSYNDFILSLLTASSTKLARPTKSSLSKTSSTTSIMAKNKPTKSTNKSPKIILASSMPSATDINSPILQLSGIVGSSPGLITKNQFVLLNAQGRGMLVRTNGKQPVPTLGTHLTVTGTIAYEQDRLLFIMRAKDRWQSALGPADVIPRHVDLTAPSSEDAWSLVEVSGTISEVRTNSLILTTSDTEITVRSPARSRVRAAHYNKGDRLQIRGLLDTRTYEAVILLRGPEDITVLQHAPQAATVSKHTSSTPPWLPITVAGVTIGVTEGVRQLFRRRSARQLAINTITPPTTIHVNHSATT